MQKETSSAGIPDLFLTPGSLLDENKKLDRDDLEEEEEDEEDEDDYEFGPQDWNNKPNPEEENKFVAKLTGVAADKCYQHCILYPDVVLTGTEAVCMLKCSERFVEALGITLSSVEK